VCGYVRLIMSILRVSTSRVCSVIGRKKIRILYTNVNQRILEFIIIITIIIIIIIIVYVDKMQY